MGRGLEKLSRKKLQKEMAYRRRVEIGSMSRRRSYEEEALDEACVELRKIMARLEVVEVVEGAGQKKNLRKWSRKRFEYFNGEKETSH